MTCLAAILVRSDSLDEVVDAVRVAFLELGATETDGGERLEVRVGEPIDGWVLITDSTHHTVDLGVAEAVATRLGRRVAAVGARGVGRFEKASVRTFGAWKARPPSSMKPAAYSRFVRGLSRRILPRPWEVDTRAGATLSFDVTHAMRTLGPFRSNPEAELRGAVEKEQLDSGWHVVNAALNGDYDLAFAALGGMRDRWGWQSTFDHVMHCVRSRSLNLDERAARLVVALARPAMAGLTATTLYAGWLVVPGHPSFRSVRLSLPLLCAFAAADDDAATELLAKLDDDDTRHRVALDVYAFSYRVIAGLSSAMTARLAVALPVDAPLRWALAPRDARDRILADAAMIAASRPGPIADEVLDAAAAVADGDHAFADALARKAYELARAGAFPGALALFDRVVALPGLDRATYCNALWAVQVDNNKLPLDPARARRYLATCQPHAEDNPPIYINAACVRYELGELDACLAALAAARRHRLHTELEQLRREPMFAALVRDPRFVELTAPPPPRRPATRKGKAKPRA